MLGGSLEGIKVIELAEGVSGPYCARLLSQMGAEVIKIEYPGRGDVSRSQGPFTDQFEDRDKSGAFLFANYNKKGITLDVTNPEGKAILLRLLQEADILIENQTSDFLKNASLRYEDLKQKFPSLIVTSISPYGRTGPYKDYQGSDLTSNAFSGLSFGTGHESREPLTTPLSQAGVLAGVGAAFATLMAVLSKSMTGVGQLVDVSESQVIGVLLTGYHLPTYIYRGVAGWRSGNRMRLGLFPNCVLPCKDGYICIDAPQMEQYQRFLDLLDDREWMENPRYRNRRAMSDEYPEEAESLIAPWFMQRTKEEILEICIENRIPCVPVKKFDEVMKDEQLIGRDFFEPIKEPDGQVFTHPGHPFRMSETPLDVKRPAPTLGQDNEDIFLGRLRLEADEFRRLQRDNVI